MAELHETLLETTDPSIQLDLMHQIADAASDRQSVWGAVLGRMLNATMELVEVTTILMLRNPTASNGVRRQLEGQVSLAERLVWEQAVALAVKVSSGEVT